MTPLKKGMEITKNSNGKRFLVEALHKNGSATLIDQMGNRLNAPVSYIRRAFHSTTEFERY